MNDDDCGCGADKVESVERRLLWTLLGLNAAMFVIEAGAAWWASSTGLAADSLDMLADALVYGIALAAVGTAASAKQLAARASGWLQILLALLVVAEALRRAVHGAEPVSAAMVVVGLLALAINAACLVLIRRRGQDGAHLRAAEVFSTNDVIANAGVILAGVLVAVSGRAWPDLVIGLAIAAVVVRGGLRIVAENRSPQR